MSILLGDAREKLQHTYGITLAQDCMHELIYADDTLLMGTHGPALEKYLACIVEAGQENGLFMNWSKVELLIANCDGNIKRPDGTILTSKASVENQWILGTVRNFDIQGFRKINGY